MFSGRRLFLGGFFLFLLAPVFAAAAPSMPEGAQQTPAGRFIQSLADRAIAVIADQKLSSEQRMERYRNILRDSFDLPTIGQFALGRSWQSTPPEKRQEYMKLFEELVVQTYSVRLGLYKGESFQVKAVRPESATDFFVNSEIKHPGGEPPTTIDWRVRQKNGGKFAVLDVIVEGVSQSITQRQEYASIMQNDAGNIDALLERMRQRLQESRTASP